MSDTLLTRPPTLEEAVAWIMRHTEPIHKKYRILCIAEYETKYGKQFADCVRHEVRKQWEARNAKKIRKYARENFSK